jgi:hypothetical protein
MRTPKQAVILLAWYESHDPVSGTLETKSSEELYRPLQKEFMIRVLAFSLLLCSATFFNGTEPF